MSPQTSVEDSSPDSPYTIRYRGSPEFGSIAIRWTVHVQFVAYCSYDRQHIGKNVGGWDMMKAVRTHDQQKLLHYWQVLTSACRYSHERICPPPLPILPPGPGVAANNAVFLSFLDRNSTLKIKKQV